MSGDDLSHKVDQVLAEPPRRVTRLVSEGGRTWWLKRVEHLSLRLRLQKGDPSRAFEAERNGLKTLAQKGIPVPEIAMEGADYFLLPDAGPTLQILVEEAADDPGTRAAFAAAGRALGLLHWAGLSHGRPAPRDICWDGTTARFIDLERFSAAHRSGFWQALDIVIFIQSCYGRWPDDPRFLDAALEAYRVNAPEDALARAGRLAFWLGWLKPMARLVTRFKPRSREFRAIPLTLARLAGFRRGD
ncbi:hypothetical protein [Rhodobacter sp. 24-YEA-8]|uniref:hypothetical protein n=1 Tax=Rhodobacter sp. 24-YEA-8 TaxID=1884310 RepID=UPI000899BBD2|nr:hypothetical protein [Rhodobacter sp. 24-YEA-8]SEC78946.1 tRNA A-37 threonylcarbamoyl transferase component Bud32 [Rhodobacter sp. 24-YEA-8]